MNVVLVFISCLPNLVVPTMLSSFMSFYVLAVMFYNGTANKTFLLLCCMALFLIWCYVLVSLFRHCAELFMLDYYYEREQMGDIESLPNARARVAIARIRANREHWQTIQLHPFPCETRTTARLAIRALPPAVSFRDDQTSESLHDCSICLEKFMNGDSIQPFGVCVHQFHSSCLNLWLLRGKSSCPLCRMELPIPTYSS
ncbi:unnamed protein product [Sphenostylis stenocarpa]|uniref:RING-type domain-containing protein n=1 Tax=Sphenostylis stenocarpa TaxID=92480 RepID=A0AA86SKP7_9FABA|nr:unnamed protein product [Sphenostylis stenocarpa]